MKFGTQIFALGLFTFAALVAAGFDGGIEIDFPISRQDIAEMTGTTLHTVSRLLSKWEDNGIIVSRRQKVTVKDAHRLVVLAENRNKG